MTKIRLQRIRIPLRQPQTQHLCRLVAHSLNGNPKTDTNLVGIPKEAWGEFKRRAPNFRAPKFEEARFDLKESGKITARIKEPRQKPSPTHT